MHSLLNKQSDILILVLKEEVVIAVVLGWELMEIVHSPRLLDLRVERLSVRNHLFL